MKKILVILLFTLASTGIYAQSYDNAVGVRGGLYSGFTYKHFLTDTQAVEAILHSRWNGWAAVGLLEYHTDIPDVDGLYWFYGYGAHVGFYDDYYTGWYDDGSTYAVVGIDGIVGIEYQIPQAPITVGLDWKPYFNLIGYTHFFGDGGALSVRFTF